MTEMLPKSAFISLLCPNFSILTPHCSCEPDRIPPSFQTQLRATSSLRPSLTSQPWDPLSLFLFHSLSRAGLLIYLPVTSRCVTAHALFLLTCFLLCAVFTLLLPLSPQSHTHKIECAHMGTKQNTCSSFVPHQCFLVKVRCTGQGQGMGVVIPIG